MEGNNFNEINKEVTDYSDNESVSAYNFHKHQLLLKNVFEKMLDVNNQHLTKHVKKIPKKYFEGSSIKINRQSETNDYRNPIETNKIFTSKSDTLTNIYNVNCQKNCERVCKQKNAHFTTTQNVPNTFNDSIRQNCCGERSTELFNPNYNYPNTSSIRISLIESIKRRIVNEFLDINNRQTSDGKNVFNYLIEQND